MTPQLVTDAHHAVILRNNARFVHWLSPLDKNELSELLGRADYARHCQAGDAVVIAYSGQGDYRHKNVDWLSDRLPNYLYVDRVIIGESSQGQGLGRILYEDLSDFAARHGFDSVACEVNTIPDNPGSHAFHRALGFSALGEQDYPDGKAVRYYVRPL